MTPADELDARVARLARAPRLLVCCDFDGTLSHLVDDPQRARPVEGAVEVMDALGGLPGTRAALVSGRSLAQLMSVCDMPSHVTLIGSHGAEFERGVIAGLGETERALLARTARGCESVVADVPGAFVEAKPASVAVHVRQADASRRESVLAAVRSGPAASPRVHVTEGKDVIEIAVVRTGKGGAVEGLRREPEGADAVVLFAGDDVTDEDAFATLRRDDVGIKVGAGGTLAGFRVDGPDDLIAVLRSLLRDRGRLVG